MERMPSETPDERPIPEPEPVSLNLQVVGPYQGPGRPLFLTPKRFLSICHLIERGTNIVDACRALSVTYAGLRRHIRRNPKYDRRIKEALSNRDGWLKEYHIGILTRAAEEDPDLSKYWLERRFPHEFSNRDVIRPVPLEDRPSIPSHVITISDIQFEELAQKPEYKLLEDGALERVIGGLRTLVIRQSKGEARL